MPAPTALQSRPHDLAAEAAMAVSVSLPADDDAAATAADLVDMSLEPAFAPADSPATLAVDSDTPMTDESGRPKFAPAKAVPLAFRREQRKVPIPPHRMTPLKGAWPKIYVCCSLRAALCALLLAD